MEHQNFKEMIQLALLNELNDDQMKALHNHLIDCSECQAEYESLSKYFALIENNKIDKADEQLLQEARRQFRLKLNYELSRQTIIERMFHAVQKYFLFNKGAVLTSAASLIIGFAIGSVIFLSGSNKTNYFENSKDIKSSKPVITNVRFLSPIAGKNQVEFVFDAVTQVKMKGSLDSPEIRKILAEALVNEKNPGARIVTVNALASQVTENKSSYPKVKDALISALKYDNNPGVRREALKALLELPYDSSINNCLLYVLEHDKNPGLRIAAINGLTLAKMNGEIINQKTLNVLNNKAKNDDNEYVRIRAASLLKEENIQ